MPWNIAEAKQQFAEVVKQAAEIPQVIYHCDMPVAVVVNAENFAKFQEWQMAQKHRRTLADDFAELRILMQESGFEDGLEIPARFDRINAFTEILVH